MAGDNVIKLTVTADPTNARQALVELGQQLVDVGGKGDGGAKVATNALLEMARAATQVRELLASLGQQLQTAGQQAGSVDKAATSVKGLASTAKDAATETTSLLDKVGGLKGILGALGIGLGVKAIFELIKDLKDAGVAVFETGRQLESLGLTFKAITGSAASAQAELANTRKIAQDYGQDFLSMAQSTKTFIASAKDTELVGAGTREVIKGISAAVAALGLSSQDAQGVFLALGQMMSKGNVQAEELRGQLGERLPGAFSLAAKAMGVSTAELGKMLEQGQVLATDLVPKLARVLEQEYAQAAKEAGETGTAAVNQLSTAWTDFKSALADTGVFSAAVKMIKWLAETATSAAETVRAFTGTLQNQAKLQRLDRRIASLEGQPTEYYDGQVSFHDNSELAALKKERDVLVSDILLAQQSQMARERAKATAAAEEKSQSVVTASQKGTLDDWSHSADKVTAAWAKLEIEKAKAYGEVISGKKNHAWMEGHIALYQDKLNEAQQKENKKGASSAKAGALADIKASGVLQKIEDEISTYEQSLGGNRLGAAIAKVEREHNQALTRIQEELARAKGGVEALHQAEDRLGELKKLKIKTAELAEFNRQLEDAAKHESSLYRDTYGAQGSQLKADWLQGEAQYLKDLQQAGYGTDLADPQKIAEAEERWRAHQQFMLDEDVRRLGEGGKLSDEYWDAEGRRLDAHLDQVKKHVADENTSQVYASQQRSELRRKELEARLGYEDDFLGYLRDYLSLEFKAYQDETTRQRAMWQEMAKSTADYFRQIGGDIENGIADSLAYLWERNAKKARESWAEMWSNIGRDSIRYVISLGATLAKNALILPVVTEFVGSIGGSSTTAAGTAGFTGGGSSGGSGINAGTVLQGASMAKGAYELAGGTTGGIISGLNTWGANTLGIGSPAMPAIVSEGNVIAPATAGVGLGTALSAGLMSGGVGYLTGNLLRSDTAIPSYVGAGAGLLAGGAAALTGIGASVASALSISAGLASTGIGALVAIPAAIAAAALTPNTTTTKWNNMPGSQPAIQIVDGDLKTWSWGNTTQTSTGLGGSYTRHGIFFQPANEKQTAEETAAWTTANASLANFTKALNFSDDELTAFAQGFTTAPLDAVTYDAYNIFAGYLAEHVVGNMGLADQVRTVAHDGESFVETLARVATGINTAKSAILASGIEIRDFYQNLDAVQIGDRVSDLVAAVGSADEFVAALTRAAKHSLSSAEVARVQALGYSRQMDDLVSQVGESVDASAIQAGTFWEHFRRSLEMPDIDPERFADLAAIAKTVEAWETATINYEQVQLSTKEWQENLDVRKLAAQGLADESSLMALQVQQERELAEARWNGATAAQLAALAEVQALEMQKAKAGADTVDGSLADIMQAVTDATFALTDTSALAALRKLNEQLETWTDQATKLGASEAELARIRSYGQAAIKKQLSDYMESFESALAEHEGRGLEYKLAATRKDLSSSLLDAAALGATRAQLTDIGTEYAYRVKDLYQAKIEEVAGTLKSMATTMKTFTDTLDKLLQGLWTNKDLSPLSLGARYGEAQRQWERSVFDLGSTDQDVRDKAMSEIESKTTAYLEASQAFNSDFGAYYADFVKVQAVLGEQSQTLKTEYQLAQEQLDAALGTQDNTDTIASLTEELKDLQQQQGDTWTQMLAELPQKIADAINGAKKLQIAIAGGGSGGGGSLNGFYSWNDGHGNVTNYGSADAYDAAYFAAQQSYMEQKVAELNATAEGGRTNWNIYDVASSISALGLTPYEHFSQYGSGEYNPLTQSYLAWDGPISAAPRNLSTGTNESYGRNDVIGPNLNIGSAFDASTYLANKVDQLNVTGVNGRSDWSAAEVAASIAGLGLTPEQHFAQYGQYEGVKPYAAGGFPSDGLFLAGEEGPELFEKRGSSLRIYSAPQSRNMVASQNADLKAELAEVRRELAETNKKLAEIARNMAGARDSLERMDTIGIKERT